MKEKFKRFEELEKECEEAIRAAIDGVEGNVMAGNTVGTSFAYIMANDIYFTLYKRKHLPDRSGCKNINMLGMTEEDILQNIREMKQADELAMKALQAVRDAVWGEYDEDEDED